MGPIVTTQVHDAIVAATRAGNGTAACSLDLDRSQTVVALGPEGWSHRGVAYPSLASLKPRTIYHWSDGEFAPVSRFSGGLVKLVPTQWGPPTFELDGIKMLPTAHVSPYDDAQRKVGLVRPRGRVVLDTCGGLGYFAAWCLADGASQVLSFEKNPSVLWLRTLNPWSPQPDERLRLTHGDVGVEIKALPTASVDAVLHDPPRFGIAGELYAQTFYDQLARVLRPGGRLFHYTGTPNALTSGRDVPTEVSKRLQRAGFRTQPDGDGIVGVRGRG